MRRRGRVVTTAIAGSVLAHLLLLALVLRVEVDPGPASPPAESQLVELTLTPIASPVAAKAATAPAEPPPVTRARAERPRPSPSQSPPPRPPPAPAVASGATAPPADQAPRDEARSSPDQHALAAALQPRAVARASAALRCAPVEPSCSPERVEEPARASPADTLQSSLDHAARAVPHLKPRPGPELKRRADGSHEYDGHVFHARVRPDGHVEFQDKAGGIAGTPLAFSFDLTDMVEKHLLDKEIYTAEKRWFLEETRALRMRLEREHRTAQQARSLRRLRGRLVAIVEDEAVSAAERRRAVFDLWNDCSDDEVGSEAQRAIEAFIRERMPRGSPLGYDDGELATLDRQRAGARRFAPYG